MTYRAPTPPPTPPENAEIAAYEAQLVRRVKRKRLITALVIGGLAIVGLGSCVGPLGVTLAQEAWSRRRTKLAPEEQRRVQNLLGPIEESAKKSQAAFEALWPKIRDSEIGARSDLGPCRVNVPGPRLRTKEESRSLEDSAEAYGWTFVDLTPSEARSPIALLKMPQGSIALNNTGTGERFSLGDKPLRLATPDRAPLLASTSDGERATALREESEQGLRADQRESYLSRVTSFADHAMPIDVIVFLDAWEEPKLTSEVKEPPPPKDDLEAFAHPAPRPTRIFETGFATAHAIAWDPTKQEVSCAAQAVTLNSKHITFRMSDRTPLEQDLVLELERALERSFVAVGDAPPKLTRPTTAQLDVDVTTAGIDAGAAKSKAATPQRR